MEAINKLPTILIVDDDPDIIEFINQIMRLYKIDDFEVIYSTTGSGAIALINTQFINAIILDVKLPDITGLTIGHKIREKLPDIPIAIFTSYESDTIIDGINEINAFYWYKLEIMANPDKLIDCFRMLLKGKSCTETSSLEELKKIGKDQKKRMINLPFPTYCRSRLHKTV
jgi:DNA-binding NtrC family response regulator